MVKYLHLEIGYYVWQLEVLRPLSWYSRWEMMVIWIMIAVEREKWMDSGYVDMQRLMFRELVVKVEGKRIIDDTQIFRFKQLMEDNVIC